jgi:Tol biopolymer transport system component
MPLFAVPPGPGQKKDGLLLPMLITIGGVAAAGILTFILLRPPSTGPDLSSYKFTPISQDEAEKRSPVWSPNGKSIAYTSRVDGVMQVFTRVVGSPDATQVTKVAQDCSQPFWSPDGATIYFLSGGNLFAVHATGGAPQQVMERVDAASLHPDGDTLAFERDEKIWITTLKTGGEPKEFWPGPANGSLAFSPDGSKLLIYATSSIWIAPFPSGEGREIMLPGNPSGQSWFPDNRHFIVAQLNGAGAGSSLTIVDALDGSRRTIEASPYGISSPSVSLDGTRIVYSTGQSGWDIWMLEGFDGGNALRVIPKR